MPSKSASQRNFMRMCASTGGRKAATSKCPPTKVAKEYVAADKRKAHRTRKGK